MISFGLEDLGGFLVLGDSIPVETETGSVGAREDVSMSLEDCEKSSSKSGDKGPCSIAIAARAATDGLLSEREFKEDFLA